MIAQGRKFDGFMELETIETILSSFNNPLRCGEGRHCYCLNLIVDGIHKINFVSTALKYDEKRTTKKPRNHPVLLLIDNVLGKRKTLNTNGPDMSSCADELSGWLDGHMDNHPILSD